MGGRNTHIWINRNRNKMVEAQIMLMRGLIGDLLELPRCICCDEYIYKDLVACPNGHVAHLTCVNGNSCGSCGNQTTLKQDYHIDVNTIAALLCSVTTSNAILIMAYLMFMR